MEDIDHLIRAGEHKKAKRMLLQVKPADVTREKLSLLSDFGRRINFPLYSLKILNKLVRSHLEKKNPMRPDEIVSYSRALVKLGFFEESLRWLDNIDSKKIAEVNDVKGRLYMHQWSYSKAIFFFKKYLNQLEPESYPYLVGSLNLCACLVFMKDHDEAHERLHKMLEVAKRESHGIILANSHELLGQNYVYQKQFKKGIQSFETSRKHLKSQDNIYHFYTKKWDWIIRLLSRKEDQSLQLEGKALKEEALGSMYWEDCREIDRYLALTYGDQELAKKLYFGTSHLSYRKLLKNEFFKSEKIPSGYIWNLREDLYSKDTLVIQSDHFPETIKGLFECLTHDFYRPLSLGYVTSKLYPDEYFDPFSTTNRLYGSVKRLREFLPEMVNISWSSEGIKLDAKAPCKIKVHSRRKIVFKTDARIISLRENLKRDWFTCVEAAEKLNVSPRSALRTIQLAKKKYVVETQGKGKSMRYRFAG